MNQIQENLFEQPSPIRPETFTGYRIKRIEVRNFGSYHGAPTSFDMECAGSIFAGENGAGKSTAFDAMNVCFNMKPRLNGAAAGESRGGNDRSVPNYYRGIVGDKETDGRVSKHTLRRFGDQETFMGIMVVFSNASGENFSAGRLLYIDDGGKNHWHYITSERALSLHHDFRSWETSGRLRTRGEQDGFDIHPNFDLFMGRVGKELGLGSSAQAQRAFRLLSLASSLQVMGSTTQFVRSYMLPDVDFLGMAEETLQAIESHGKARAKIALTRKQIADLENISRQLNTLDEAFTEEVRLHRIEQGLPLVQSYMELLSTRRMQRFYAMKANAAKTEHEADEKEVKQLDQEIDVLNEAIKAADGDQIEFLERELDTKIREKNRITAQRTSILEIAIESGMEPPVSADKAGWKKIEKHLATLPGLQEQIGEMQIDYNEIGGRIRQSEKDIESLEGEIEKVRKAGSPIRSDLRNAREEIARSCGLEPDDMPFMGELMQVEEKSRDGWEFAANQLLGAIATKMLVPESRYEAAKAAMEASEAQVRIRLEAMTEARIGKEAQSRARVSLARLDKRAMAHKIELRDHPFSTYVQEQLAHRADHLCVSGEEFPRTRGKAITQRASISHSDTSAEKDGTRSRNQRSNYVLGWSVEDRIAILQAEILAIDADLEKDRQMFENVEGALKALNTKRDVLNKLSGRMCPWEEVDTSRLASRVDYLREELDRIQTDDMRKRRERCAELETKRDEKKERLNKLGHEIIQRETQLTSAQERIGEKVDDMRTRRAAAEARLTRDDYKTIRRELLENIDIPPGCGHALLRAVPMGQDSRIRGMFEALSVAYRARISNGRKSLSQKGLSAVKAIDEYLDTYDGERNKGLTNQVRGADLDGHHEREQWRARLVAIRERELPVAQEEADKFRQNTLRTNVMALQSKLNTYDQEVRIIIAGVNTVLEQNIFNPKAGTFAKIRVDRSKDQVIVAFDALLSQALDQHTDRSEADQFQRYADIADFLRDDEKTQQRDRRQRIQYLANRWDATIRELRIEENGTERLVRQIDSGQSLSGGERERFSAFMMGVAVNTAFKAYDESVRDHCLHTMLIDEAFSKSDSETTRAAIQVLEAFGLQIIAATPMSKIRPFEPVARTIFMISRPGNLQTATTRMEVATLNFGNLSDDDSDLENFKFAADAEEVD
ncbi:ATP-binding protein [Thioclava sp. JE_KL1]|uniref:ATP-binding protein n=1 Tax=Thioclava sp. JE_KL1 TaxID=2651187 RepID=UPI00128E1789|nr:SbcC/MukB-like Walker B domain-containing protein [Thioclava sp. JE_KL1]MPQ96184.1 AAA family ATPase [Thioclava sp. JE_KL1]